MVETIKTNIYKINNDYAINIPTIVLPKPEIQEIHKEIKRTGKAYTIPDNYVGMVRHYTDGRTFITIKHAPNIGTVEAISEILGLNPLKPIQIRLYGTSEWINAHKEHGVYGRVYIKKKLVNRTDLTKYDFYPIRVRGYLPDTYKIITIYRYIRKVVIKYLENIYPTEKYKKDSYRWVIPKNLYCIKPIETAFKLGYRPQIECLQDGEFIYVNFLFTGYEIKIIKELGDKIFRTSQTLNISLSTKRDYYFTLDIKSYYLSVCPKTFILDPNGKIITIGEGEAWTNRNIFNRHYCVANTRHGQQTSFNEETGEFDKPLKRTKWDKRKQRMIEYEIYRKDEQITVKGLLDPITKQYEGLEMEFVSFGEAYDKEEKDANGNIKVFDYCLKRFEYTKDQFGKPEPFYNQRIEKMTKPEELQRIGRPINWKLLLWVDKNGFIWRT